MKNDFRRTKKITKTGFINHYFILTAADIYTGYINKKFHNELYKINKEQKSH